MKLELTKQGIRIQAENEQDEAYLNDTIGCESGRLPTVQIDRPIGLPQEIYGLNIRRTKP